MENQKQLVPLVHKVDNTAKHFEDRLYLVCLSYISNNDNDQEWHIIKGRSNTYEWIKERIDGIDFENSFVLVETVKLPERISVYSFLKKVSDYFEDSFDPDDYIKGDWDEQYFLDNSNELSEMMVLPEEQLSMKAILNGEIPIEQLN